MRYHRHMGFFVRIPLWLFIFFLILIFAFWYLAVVALAIYGFVQIAIYANKMAMHKRAEPEVWRRRKAIQKTNREALHAYWRSWGKDRPTYLPIPDWSQEPNVVDHA